MARDLYVYYRAACNNAEALQAKVRAMHRSIFDECAIVGSLKWRPDEKEGRHTWMEVYLAIPDGFETLLERTVAEVDLAPLIDGERHSEIFLDYSTCA